MRINPSSAAFMLGNGVVTEYDSGCLRNLLLKNLLPKVKDIAEKYKVMGEQGELIYQQFLLNEQDHPFHRELPFKSTIDGVVISGRMDFLVYHPDFRVVVECKTSESYSFRKQVIQLHEPKISHLAQILFYLSVLGETRAKLVALYVPKMESATIKIEVKPNGSVFVDNRLSVYTIQQQLLHQVCSAKVINEQIMWDRPLNRNACKYCMYSQECDAWDTGQFNDVTALVTHFNNSGG